MKTTLYGFYGAKGQVWYFNGCKWRYYSGKYWCDGVVQDWSHEEFDKSLTVNNFKEK